MSPDAAVRGKGCRPCQVAAHWCQIVANRCKSQMVANHCKAAATY